MTMTSEEARAWLAERTVGELNKLLEGWATHLWTTESVEDRDGVSHIIPYVVIIRGSASFGEAVDRKVSPMYPAANTIEATIFAMARAIAAGEMKIAGIEAGAVARVGSLCPIKRFETAGRRRACFLAMGHSSDHEDTLGHWYEDVSDHNAISSPIGRAIPR